MGARSVTLGFDSRRAVYRNNYAFVDGQNVVRGLREEAWRLDWRRFRQYLGERHRVTKAYLFTPLRPRGRRWYAMWRRWDFVPALKPATAVSPGRSKANVDVDLVFRVIVQFGEYHQAVIVSGASLVPPWFPTPRPETD